MRRRNLPERRHCNGGALAVAQGYRKIHAAKVRAARRKLRRKQARWRDKTIIRNGRR